MIKIENIRISVLWENEFTTTYENLRIIKELIDSKIKEVLGNEIEVSMVTMEKNISEVLYEDAKFRIVRTKNCKAIVQIKHEYSNNTKTGFTWKDKAFFSSGTDQYCFEKAKEEIKSMQVKRIYKSRKSERKLKYVENIPNEDKEMLRALLG